MQLSAKAWASSLNVYYQKKKSSVVFKNNCKNSNGQCLKYKGLNNLKARNSRFAQVEQLVAASTAHTFTLYLTSAWLAQALVDLPRGRDREAVCHLVWKSYSISTSPIYFSFSCVLNEAVFVFTYSVKVYFCHQPVIFTLGEVHHSCKFLK